MIFFENAGKAQIRLQCKASQRDRISVNEFSFPV
jgi:hypothetical protein